MAEGVTLHTRDQIDAIAVDDDLLVADTSDGNKIKRATPSQLLESPFALRPSLHTMSASNIIMSGLAPGTTTPFVSRPITGLPFRPRRLDLVMRSRVVRSRDNTSRSQDYRINLSMPLPDQDAIFDSFKLYNVGNSATSTNAPDTPWGVTFDRALSLGNAPSFYDFVSDAFTVNQTNCVLYGKVGADSFEWWMREADSPFDYLHLEGSDGVDYSSMLQILLSP